MAKSTAVLKPNLGLYLNVPDTSRPLRALKDGRNFRINNGALTNLEIGFTRFRAFQLDSGITMMDRFFPLDGIEQLILATKTDLYRFNADTNLPEFLTPRYEVGTASVSAADPAVVTGIGTLWLANVKAGDKITFGAAGVVLPASTWYTVASVGTNLSITLTGPVVGAPLGAAAYTLRSLFTGGDLNVWDPEVFNYATPTAHHWYATNGVDFIVRWDGAASQVTRLSGLGIKAKYLKVFANMMIYLNVEQAGSILDTTIINSHTGEPENITSGLSEQFVVHATSDPIIGAELLGDNLVIYCAQSAVLVQFVGDPFIFVFRHAITGTGPISGKLIVNFGDFHQFIGSNSQYRFDGASARPIGLQVWTNVMEGYDPSRDYRCFHILDVNSREVLWVLPLVDDPDTPPNTAYSEHYLEQVEDPRIPAPYGRRDFPFTAAASYVQTTGVTWDTLVGTWDELSFQWDERSQLASFPQMLVGDATGKVYILNDGQSADGVAMDAFVLFGRRAVGDGRMRGLVSRIYPFASDPQEAGSTLEVSLWLSDHSEGDAVQSEIHNFDLGLPEGGHFVTPYRRARFVDVEFGSSTLNAAWDIAGYDIDARRGGKR